MIVNEKTTVAIQLLALAREDARPCVEDCNRSGISVEGGGLGGRVSGLAVIATGKLVGSPIGELLSTVGIDVGSGAVVTGATGSLVSGATGAALLLLTEGITVGSGTVVTGATG